MICKTPSINVRMKFKSGPLAVRAALSHVLSELEDLDVAQDELGTIEIVLAEAMNNIVEHAYPEGSSPGPIDIDCRSSGHELHVRIVDDGYPMPGDTLPDGRPTDVDTETDDLPEGGFGWFLIRQLARKVDYSRSNGQNVLDIQLALGAGS